MTNKEKFKDKMLEIALGNFAFAVDRSGNVVACDFIQCYECKMYKEEPDDRVHCVDDFKKWLNEEYKEPKIDPRLYNAPVDAKILVSKVGTPWLKQHFCKIESDRVFAFSDGRTSFSCHGEDDITGWSYGKLWEEDTE